ncbi:MAG: hypothetical protein KDE27_22025 [Planctomycetes bacterium]|nr:hypothetical protein [Planctomycetota bacterium]
MDGDEVFRRCVTALWTLIGSLRADDEAGVGPAAAEALAAIGAARGDDAYLLLHEVDGALHVNGHMLPMSIDSFAAASALTALFRERGVGEVLFDDSVDATALLDWARAQADGSLDEVFAGVAGGIQTVRREVLADEAAVRLLRGDAAEEAPDSRLRSMFLQHHLILAFGTSTWVPPHQAKLAIGAVVDRMLGVEGGMEPLMLLQRDAELLYRSLHVAVLSVVFARAFGWPEDGLADLGSAALLHDIGHVLDPEAPGSAALLWLLDRGADDFWLRSAVVARSWRRDHGRRLADLGPDDSFVAAIVRLAAAVERLTGSAPAVDEVERGLRSASDNGVLPIEMVEAAVLALAQWREVA